MYNQTNQFQGQGQFNSGVQYQAPMYAPGNVGGYNYAPMPQAKMTQGLTVEEIKELRRKGSGFSLDIPPIEFKRAKCTHKENGAFSLINNNDGSHTCSICGETIVLADYDVEVAKQVTSNFLDLFQSTKLYYLNMPESYIENITQMIPVIKQLPELYRIALADFSRYETAGNGLQNRGGMNGSNLLNCIINPGYMQPQQYQQPMNQPQYQQQPMQYPQQGQQPYYGQPQQYNGDPNYNQQYQQQPGQYPQQPQGQGYQSNGFGYNAGQQPVVNNGQQAPQSNVQGGQGSSFSKENAAKTTDPNTVKIYNS